MRGESRLAPECRRSRELRIDLWWSVVAGGLEVFVVPMPGFRSHAGVLGVRFGSVDVEFDRSDGSRRSAPAGVAHFLEHELFKKEGHDALMEFGRWGASANAYTGHTTTVYFFQGAGRFGGCLDLLLRFTLQPYFDDAYVERERAIISQELRMYQDMPDYRAMRELLSALFRRHPVRIEVGGTLESIEQVRRHHLEELYHGFYRPRNMFLVAAGDVEPARVTAAAEEALAQREEGGTDLRRWLPEEPPGVERPWVETVATAARPRVLVGWKDTGRRADARQILLDRVRTGMALERIFGLTSDFRERWYRRGLIDGTFQAAYRREANFGLSVVGGETQRPEELAGRILEEVEAWRTGRRRLKRRGVQRTRRAWYGRLVASFDAPAEVALGLTEVVAAGIDPLELPGAIRQVRREALEERLEEHWVEANRSVVIVRGA